MPRNLRPSLTAALAAIALAAFAHASDSPARRSLLLATTTSTQDSGLLDLLVPRFEREHGIEVKVIAVGTGAALKMGAEGNADGLLVHAPDAERKHVESGVLIDGQLIMYNDFILVGPPGDPARVGKAGSLAAAMRAVAAHGAFISRGDDSGTHKQELKLWAAAGVDPGSVARREETGQGMGTTLHVADQKASYTLTDRGTWLSLRGKLALAIAFQGAPELRNIYHAYVVNPERHSRVQAASARAFVDFLIQPSTQEAIGQFRKQELGEALFTPAARVPAAAR